MDDGRKGHGGDSEWRDHCRRWTGNRSGRCGWQGMSLEGSRRPGLGWRGEGGGGSRGHRVVGGKGPRIRTERGVGPGGRSIATGLRRKPVRGCCKDPAGNAGKPVLRTVTQMSVWGQCVPRSWHLIRCVWNISKFSPYVEVPTSDPGGQVLCQMSNRSCVLRCVSRFRHSCGYVKVIERTQPAAADGQEA